MAEAAFRQPSGELVQARYQIARQATARVHLMQQAQADLATSEHRLRALIAATPQAGGGECRFDDIDFTANTPQAFYGKREESRKK